MKAACPICYGMEPHVGKPGNTSLDEFITGRIINSKNWTLHFSCSSTRRDSQNVKIFLAIILSELLCLSVSSPVPLLFFFLQVSAYSLQTYWLLTLAYDIHFKCSSSTICLLWASDFLKCLYLLPQSLNQRFSCKTSFQYIGHHITILLFG